MDNIDPRLFIRRKSFDAETFFRAMPSADKDVATWNVMVNGYCNNGRVNDALRLFSQMPHRGWILLCGERVKLADFGLAKATKLNDATSSTQPPRRHVLPPFCVLQL
ncbi:hypothetical protein RYX36_005122 [Vicia faba]